MQTWPLEKSYLCLSKWQTFEMEIIGPMNNVIFTESLFRERLMVTNWYFSPDHTSRVCGAGSWFSVTSQGMQNTEGKHQVLWFSCLSCCPFNRETCIPRGCGGTLGSPSSCSNVASYWNSPMGHCRRAESAGIRTPHPCPTLSLLPVVHSCSALNSPCCMGSTQLNVYLA